MEKSLNNKSWISDFLLMLPAFMFVLSILLVRLHQFSMPMSGIYWSSATDSSTLTDVFNFWKASTVIFAAGLALAVCAFAYFKDHVRFKKSFLYIPAVIYAVFVLLSFVFSDYKYFALRGMSEHFEGTVVLLSYIIMVLFLANAVDNERRLKSVVYCAFFAAFLLGILGITQATGHDFFSTTAGQKLMTPNFVLDNGMKSWDMIDILALSGQRIYDVAFKDGEVYQTVYNINYVSLYLSLLIPVSAILFIYFGLGENKGKRSFSILFLVLFGLLSYNLIAAKSAAGYVGLCITFISALIVFRKYLKQWAKYIICLIVVLGLVMGVLADRWLPEIVNTLKSALTEFTAIVYAEDNPDIQYDYEFKPASIYSDVDFVETHENYMLFGINGEVLRITRDDASSSFAITDEQGNQLYLRPIENREGVFEILDDRFHDYVTLSLAKDEYYTHVIVGTRFYDWNFTYNGEAFLFNNPVGKQVSLSRIEHGSLVNKPELAHGRGLIWGETMPLLKGRLLWGSGADTYTFVYPQNDYALMYSLYREYRLNRVTDKAHNLYMQYWVNTGLISLLAWLTLVGYYLVGAVKQFRKRGFADFSDFVNGGIFCGIIGFLFVAFFNDGSVNTMPMFYTMLGTGLAINMRDKWPNDEPVGETSGSDGADPGEGKKKGKKAAKVMPEM